MQNAKWFFSGILVLLINAKVFSQQLKLGKNPYVVTKSAVLELESPNQGLLFPRIADTALINALNPPDGMVIFHIPSLQLWLRSSGVWKPLTVSSALNSYWSTTGNGGTTASNFLGTTDLRHLYFKTNGVQGMMLDSAGNLGIGASPLFTAGAPREKLLVDAGGTLTSPATSFNVISGKGYIDNYLQLNIQNRSPGVSASSDVVASNNSGDESNNFIDMGINSSGNSSTNILGGNNTAYLYSTGGDLAIGNGTATKSLQFFSGGLATTNERMRIVPGGNIGIGVITPTAYLHLKAGTTGAGTAPLKFTSGPLITSTVEPGALEFLTDKFYGTITTGPARKEFTLNDTALTAGRVPFVTGSVGRLRDLPAFTYSVNRLSPTYLTLAAGTATAGSAPLLMTSGIKLTAPQAGAIEYDGTHFYGTVGSATRFQLDQQTTGTNTGDQTITLTGDVTGSGTGSFATTVTPNVITYAKIQQAAANKLLGNPTGSLANVSEIALGTGLSFVGSTLTYTPATSGTVTSVGLSLPSIFTVTNSPVTSTGTLTGTFNTQTANLIFAGPATGTAVPTFRALAPSDLPIATSLLVGGVSVGTGLAVSAAGVLSTTSAAPSGAAGGDLTGTYPNPTLVTTGVTAASYGNNTGSSYPYITVDTKGRITGASSVSITGAGLGAITALNGITGTSATSQSFAIGNTGTAPLWNSAVSTHTLNIPLASAAGVTAGLLSNSEYSIFNNKVGSISLGGTAVDAATTFSVSGGVATGTRTLNTQTANLVFAGPSTGTAATPTFRSLAAADLPIATVSALGGISVGAGLAITAGGLLSATNTNGGTVTSVSATGTQGVTASVATPATTPVISIGLGAITPTSVAAAGTVTGTNLSGTNTGDQTITLTGDVTGSGTGSFATTVIPNVITYAKIQQAAANKLLGNPTGALANSSEIGLGTGLSFVGSTLTYTPATSGTVTSVGLSLPSIFTVTNSPVTSTGTLTGTFNTQTANLIFAGPATGTAVPTFRALAPSDLPIATSLLVGGVSVGTGLAVSGAGVLSTTSAAPSGAAGGDLTGTYPNPTLVTTGVTAASYGNNTGSSYPYITVDAKGRITGASSVSITGAGLGAITALNGITGTSATSQSFAIGNTGTAPLWNSAVSTHTLNIPLASATGVTAGLLSNTDWSTFNSKAGTANVWSLTGNGGTTSGTNFIGTTGSQSFVMRTNNLQGLLLDSLGNVGVGSAPLFTGSPNREKFLVDAGTNAANDYINVVSGKGTTNNYLQVNIQNRSAGAAASSDVVATNNLGTESANYIDMGINSSGFASGTITGAPNTAYLFATGNDFVIGNQTTGRPLRFYTTGGTVSTDAMLIDSAGRVGIANAAPTQKLDVTGNIRLSGALMPNNNAGTAGYFLSSTGAGTAPTWNAFDTTSITGFSQKVRSLFAGTAPITYSNGQIGITQASTSTNGYLSSADWNTFNSKLGSVTSGNLTETGSGILTITGGTGAVLGSGTSVQVKQATALQSGFLSNTDWTTFNNKQGTLTFGNVTGSDFGITGGSGAVIGSGLGLSLATVNTNIGTFGSTTVVPQITVNGKGLITAISPQTIAFPVTSVNTATGAVSLGISNMNDATITTPATNQVLQYNGTKWVNTTPSYISSAITSLNGLTAAIQTFATPGTSGTAPIWSSTGSVHTLNIPLASAASVTAGLLSNTDWTTFNNKLSTIDTGNISNFYIKSRSLLSAGTGIGYNNGTGVISNTGVLSVNGNIGALTMDTGYIASFAQKSRSLFAGTAPITYANGVIGITQASTSTNGYLSSADWNTFNSKLGSVTSGNLTETGSGILTITGGTGAVLGSGTSIQVKQATTSQNGFLSSTDWTTFNNKLTTIDTTNITNFYIKSRSLLSAGTGIGYNNATGVISNTGVLSVNGNIGALTMDTGYIASFAQKTRSLFAGTAPITYSNGQIGITQAGASTNGYLSSTDWSTFNNKAGTANVWSLTGNGGTTSGTNFIGTTGSQSFVMRTNNLQGLLLDSLGNVGVGSAPLFTVTPNREKFLVDAGTNAANDYINVVSGKGTTNNYLQVNIQNRSAGAAASSDVVATNNAGTESANYIDMGINSSGFASGTITGAPNTAYLFATGNDFVIGNQTTGRPLRFYTTGGTVSTDAMLIDSAGRVGIANAAPTQKLDVTGNIRLSGALMPNNNAGTAGYFLSSTGAGSAPTWNAFDTTSITGFSQKVRSLFAGTAPITYSNGQIGITQASTSTNGYLSSTDWNTFNSKLGSVTSGNLTETGSGVLTITGGTGAVLGSGTSVQVKQATASQSGFLSSTDWTTFNNKLTIIDTTNISNFSAKVRSLFSGTAPITYTNGLIGITQASTSTNGYLSSADWTTFNNKASTANVWSLTGNSATNSATNFLGTTDLQHLFFRTNNVQGMVLDSLGNVGIGLSPFFTTANREKLLVDAGVTNSFNVISGKGSINNYLQLNIQNKSAGTLASTDVVATADNGDETTNYVDMGINSSGNNANYFGSLNDSYLYNLGQNFLIGTGTPSKSVIFLTGGGTQTTNERMRIDGSGNIGIGTNNPLNKLSILGTNPLFLSGVQTGSLADSLVTISSGVIKKINVSSLGSLAVTSVGLSLPSIFSVSGSPVTTTGTLTGTLVVQPANKIFAGPTSGADAVPAFRSLVSADLPLATASSIGGISAGAGLTVSAGVLSSNLSATAPLLYSNLTGIISIPKATTGVDGYLSAADWNIFNSKASSSNVWSLSGNGGTVPGTNFLGTTDLQHLIFKTNNAQGMMLDSAGNVGIGLSPTFSTNREKLLVDAGSTGSFNVISGKGTINNYLQLNIQNKSGGTNASSDVVATADNGDETTNYIDMGINSSGNNANYFGSLNDSYLYNLGQNFLIGTGTPGKNLMFLTGGGVQSTNERMRIDGSGNVGIGITNAANPLVVKDVMEIRRVGSVSQLLFSNTASAGDFRIAGDGGDIFWQGGGSRALQMGSFWGMVLSGDRQTGVLPSFQTGVTGTGVLIPASRDGGIPLAIQAFSPTHSANLTEWRNSSAAALSVVDKNGNFGIGITAPTSKLHVVGTNPLTLLGVQTGTATDSLLTITTAGVVRKLPYSTFTTGGITSLNTLTATTQTFAIGTTGTAPLWNSAVSTHTLNIPLASAASVTAGLLSNADWNTFNNKASTANVWSLTGNAGTSSSSNFLGTTDAQDMVFKTGNTERLRIVNGVSTSSGTAGDITIGSATSGTIRSNQEFVMRQDGDVFGASVLRLRNRNGENGAIFETIGASASLVDFIFKTGTVASPLTSNIRFETRTGSSLKVTGNSTEWQFGQPDVTNGGPTLVVGAAGTGSNSAFRIGNLGIGTTSPSEKLDISGNLRLSGALMPGNNAGTSGFLLTSGGAGVAPTWTNPASLIASNSWSLTGNTGTTSGTNYIGTADPRSFVMRTGGIQGFILDSLGNVGVGAAPIFTASPNREEFLVDAGINASDNFINVISGKGNTNNYIQMNIQNRSAGAAASSDVVATNDLGSESANFIDMGINSTQNTSTGMLGGINTAYLYATGNDFSLGNASNKALRLFTGGTAVTNERMRIDSSGNVGIGNTAPVQKLDITGNLRLSGNIYPTIAPLGQPTFLSFPGIAGQPAQWTVPSVALNSISWGISGNNGMSTSNYLGTTDNVGLYMRTKNIHRLYIDTLGNVAVGTGTSSTIPPAFSAAPNQEKFLVDGGSATPSFNLISGKGTINNYLQLNIQNKSTGTAASSDVVATNDAGTEANGINYVDMGVNGSGNTSTGVLGGANNAYLYATGTDFAIGNSGTGPLKFFTGTTENMRIDASGNVGIGTSSAALASDFTLNQKTSAVATSRGFRFSGVPITGGGAGSGFAMTLGYNDVNNKQLWLGDPEYLGNASSSFLRISSGSGYSTLDAITGNNGTRRPIALGVGGDASAGVILGFDGNATIPSSYVWANGNMAIGSGYRANSAPTNGLIVQGGIGVGTSSPSQALDVNGNINAQGSVFVDGANANASTVSPGLVLGGSGSGESIASRRVGGTNQYGIDFYTASNLRMTIYNAGNVGIGTGPTAPTDKLTVDGIISPFTDNTRTLGTSAKRWSLVYAANGTINTSDRRLKTNITKLNYGLKEILTLQPVSFNWKTTPDSDKKLGLIAQEVRKVIPEVVVGDEAKETLGMNYSELVPVLINAIKEQQKQIDYLKEQVIKLQKKS